jgi:glucose-1-phosphate thymidylyltransferase
MLPAANRPILEHVLDALVEAGVENIVLVVGYRRERVQEYFGPSYRNVPLEYVVQRKQLGSGHALLQAREAVDGPLLVVNGDQITEASAVRSVRDTFDDDPAPAVMAVLERRDAGKYGAITIRDRDVENIVEKPGTDEYRLMNGGVYAFKESIFDDIEETPREEGELSLTDTIARIVDRDRVRGVRTGGLWVDATYPWDLLEVATEVLARGRVVEPQRREGVWVDDDATVHEDATVRPPVAVGPDCEVAPGAVIGPSVALGRNVTVGANATIERSVLDADTRVDAGSTLRDAVLGQDVHLGAAATIPGGPADVRVDREVFENQRLGAVVADRTRARGDVSFDSGALVGPNVTIGTGVDVRGTIPEGAEVLR